ncbi:MAG: hypothetical protein EA376_13000 [Phycisphaeraceae bacterium]|nr:MAG: hypothetical protein EA376_13000 [Phycisphaeraceae bacterium]
MLARTLGRTLILLFSLALIIQAFLLWNGTGRAAWTRYHNPVLAPAPGDDDNGFADLFAGTGLDDERGPLEANDNRFALGLFPSTYPWALWDRHIVSFATLAGPAALIALITFAGPLRRGMRKRKARRKAREVKKQQAGDSKGI